MSQALVIKDAVRRYVPFGERCQCPCGGGIAPEQPVDALVVASVSNWGAYGIAAAVSVSFEVSTGLMTRFRKAAFRRQPPPRDCVMARLGGLDPSWMAFRLRFIKVWWHSFRRPSERHGGSGDRHGTLDTGRGSTMEEIRLLQSSAPSRSPGN